MRAASLGLAALAVAGPAAAEPLAVTKSATVISDQLGYTAVPRSLPGAVVDYKVLYQNPATNAFKPVRQVVSEYVVPANVVLRVVDLAAAGKGPVEFLDGSPLGSGLLASGLGYVFTSLSNTSDGIEFYNGASWAYVPQPDSDGYDPHVRAVRITMTSTFATNTQFQHRYRVKIR